MVTFLVSIALLVLGFFIYGKYVDRFFGSDPSRVTPAVEKADGVDFQPLPVWKIFIIQFLNIAGLGPIFGAIMGAAYGPVAHIWIVVGCIFMGAVHDYFSGMLSMR
ncbi:MAG: carbon starvation protein A, partial [Bacteroidales bacterium]|nr:carbon starvation protein A [Bacteroidales bacterium]